MGVALSILICTIPEREWFLNRLMAILSEQPGDYEILINASDKTIGRKRNELLSEAKGDYVAAIDDDDTVSDNYIKLLMEGIYKGVDCCSLTGIITDDGKNPRKFIHSIKYKSWYEDNGVYFRNPNHLNCIKTGLARRAYFPETNHGEDRSFSDQLFKLGVLQTEHEIKQVIYFYEHRTK